MDNNLSLISRLTLESVAAFVAAFTVSPAICIIDKAIVSNASGLEPLNISLKNGFRSLITTPKHFFKQRAFMLIFGVQLGTYAVANNIEALCERYQQETFYPKCISCSCVNVTLSVLKDRAYARMFGKDYYSYILLCIM